jgi:uncharacterized membrane protein YhaH (DUF805 family)
MQWYFTVLKKYDVFQGRSQRAEYWMFFLFNMIISAILGSIDIVLSHEPELPFGYIYSLVVFIPNIAVIIRRLHDTGRNGWNVFWIFLPIIGWIILFAYFVQDSKPGTNQYGPNPKERF